MDWCLGTQCTGTELVEGILGHQMCQERWEEMDLFGLRIRWMEMEPHCSLQLPDERGWSREGRAGIVRLFWHVCGDMMRANRDISSNMGNSDKL